MDDASSVFDASILTGPVANFPVADSFNRKLERDYSTGDIPHVFVASAVWDIPFGAARRSRAGGVIGALVNDWTLTGVLTLQSGMPLAVTQTTNNNAFAGFGTQRPNLVGDPTLPADERSVNRWFNTSAFAAAPAFTIGTSSQKPGPRARLPQSRSRADASCAAVGQRALEVRAEVFNVTNTPPFAGAEHDGRISGVRHDHGSRRSSRRSTGAEILVLKDNASGELMELRNYAAERRRYARLLIGNNPGRGRPALISVSLDADGA